MPLSHAVAAKFSIASGAVSAATLSVAATETAIAFVDPGADMLIRIGTSCLGAGTALMLRPPRGNWKMVARFWSGAFGGFIAAPFIPKLIPAIAGLGHNTIALSASGAAFVLFFLLQATADVLASRQLKQAMPGFLGRMAKALAAFKGDT